MPDSWLMELLLGTRGGLRKSIEHNRKAVEVQSARGDYMKELGVSLICRGVEDQDAAAREEGREWLRKAYETPSWSFDRDVDREHIDRLLERPEDACGYSRDLY